MSTSGLRTTAAIATVATLSGLVMALSAPTATAEVRPGKGHETVPAQPYRNNPDTSDWIGSYLVDGKQVFCVQFAYKAPDSDESYRPGEPLKTKWGTELAPDVAADISYLLLRYGDTGEVDEASALAHLLHSWTAAPQHPGQLDPANDFRHIAYDVDGHFARLPESTRATVGKLRADAAANRGPWTANLVAPTDPQLIGIAGRWTVDVRNAAGKGIGGVPVTVTATDATLAGGKSTDTISTPADGAPLAVAVTPTGEHPKVTITLASPADRPVVRDALDVNTQRIVSTGGEKELTALAETTARTPPGVVRVIKTDAKSGAPIAAVGLRLTGEDRKSPALDQDDKPLLGADGTPAIVRTGDDGVAAVTNLRTPQTVCLIEIAAPVGYEQNFDRNSPPAACGNVTPGETVELSLTNVPNLPKTVPAGVDDPSITSVAQSQVMSRLNPVALAGAGGALLLVAGLVGLLWRRRWQR
jgi:hypothetical protein